MGLEVGLGIEVERIFLFGSYCFFNVGFIFRRLKDSFFRLFFREMRFFFCVLVFRFRK